MVRSLAVVASLAVVPTTASAGWTQAEGDHYLKTWVRLLVGSKGYFSDGRVREATSYTDIEANLYFEYGLTDSVTLIAGGAPLGWAFADTDGPFVGALYAGARYGIKAEPLYGAIEARYGYSPPWGKTVARGTTDGHSWVFKPAVETHRVEGELQLGIGLPLGIWTKLTAGARGHTRDGMGLALIGFAQVGIATAIDLTADLHLNLYEPLEAVTRNNISGRGETRYLGIGIGLTYWITDRWGVNAAFEGVAYANSNAATPSILLGFEHTGGAE